MDIILEVVTYMLTYTIPEIELLQRGNSLGSGGFGQVYQVKL